MRTLERVLIVYNPNALRGKIDRIIPEIKQRLFLRFSQVDAMFSRNFDGAESIAFKNASKYDIIVACGGDGTVHQVINGVKKSGAKCLIGILPFGTCNDVAHTLKIPRNIQKALDCILRLNTTKYDLMFDGTNYIAYTLATGYLTSTSYATKDGLKKRFGRFGYFLSALKHVFKFSAIPLTVCCDGERIHGKFAYFMLLNGKYVGGFNINKDEALDNGKIKLVMVKKTKTWAGFFAMIKMFMFGIKSVKKSKSIIVRDCKSVEIENHSNSGFTADGEKWKFLKKSIVVDSSIELIVNY